MHIGRNFNFIKDHNLLFSIRFVLLFGLSLIFALYITATNDSYQYEQWLISYFKSFLQNDLLSFVKNLVLTSYPLFLVLIFTCLSSMTFFCSPMLHLTVLLCGLNYGFQIRAMLCSGDFLANYNAYILAYIFFALAFGVGISVLSAKLLKINLICIENKNSYSDGKRIFVSKVFIDWIKISLSAVLLYIVLRLVAAIVFAMINAVS